MYKLQSDSVMVPFRHSTCVYWMIYDSLSWCLTNSSLVDHIRRVSKVLNYLSMIMVQLCEQMSDQIYMLKDSHNDFSVICIEQNLDPTLLYPTLPYPTHPLQYISPYPYHTLGYLTLLYPIPHCPTLPTSHYPTTPSYPCLTLPLPNPYH